MPTLKEKNLHKECSFKTTRSSGPGGQHANKVETRVELRFKVSTSEILTEKQKLKIQKRLKKKINKEDELIVTAEASRSQLRNREEAIEKFYRLIEKALKKRKKRKKTKPDQAVIEQRLREKRQQSEKKTMRKKPDAEQ